MGQIRVLVADDHPLVRKGLALFLAAFPDLAVVGEATGGVEALRRCADLLPDVVLMDLVMPGLDGADATRLIRATCPQTQVLVLTSFGDDGLVRAALAAGAIGYLLKTADVDEIAAAIRAVHTGQPVLAPEAAQALVRSAAHPHGPGADLTPREREVLTLLAEGMNNGAIAERLVISRSTVKFHVSRVLAKLGAGSRTEAAALAVQRRLVAGPA